MSKKIVEINGMKFEVDLAMARKIEEFRIGDNVKVLKQDYRGYKVYPGVIVEFVNFQKLPTIIIAYLEDGYTDLSLHFLSFNEQTEDVEISLCSDHELVLEKGRMIDKFNDTIDRKRHEMEELIAKRDYFDKYFNKYFGETGDSQ